MGWDVDVQGLIPIGPGGESEPTGYWEAVMEFGPYEHWWRTDGSGGGGDPLTFPWHEDSIDVTITATWHGEMVSAANWWLGEATVTRWTPTVTMIPVDTAVENKGDYLPGQAPGFIVSRAGDQELGDLVVNLEDKDGTAVADGDYEILDTTARILAGDTEVFVPLNVINGEEKEWTETVEYELREMEDGRYLLPDPPTPSTPIFATAHIVDDDGVDIHVDGLPDELEDEDFNEADPGLFIRVNDDDDNGNFVPDWEETPAIGDDDLEEVKLRFPGMNKTVGEAPNVEHAQVKLEINSLRYRVWSSEGELLLPGPNNEQHKFLDPAEDGPEMTVYVEALPPPSGVAELGPPPALLTLRALDVGERSTTTADQVTLVGIRHRLRDVTFAATTPEHFHPVYLDGLQAVYAPPHWIDDDLDGTPEAEHPVAYRREARMLLTVQITWDAGAGQGNALAVRGEGPGGFDFQGSLNGDPDPASQLTLDGNELTLTDAADGAFANTVDHFDTMDIVWSVSKDGGDTWTPVGTSRNQVYVLLDAPEGTPLYHTLAHVSTKAAEEQNSQAGVIDKVWGVFENAPGIERMDGTTMRYYASWLTNVGTTAGILGSEEGDGTCDAWVSLFLDMLKAHGIRNDDNFVVVNPAANEEAGFIIKNWGAPAGGGQNGDAGYPYLNLVLKTGDSSSADLIRHASYNWAYAEVVEAPGIGGQGNDNPASLFRAHVLAKIGDRYYDVAYGQDYGSLAEWETAVLMGYYMAAPRLFDEAQSGIDVNGNGPTDAEVPVWRYVFRPNPAGNQAQVLRTEDY